MRLAADTCRSDVDSGAVDAMPSLRCGSADTFDLDRDN